MDSFLSDSDREYVDGIVDELSECSDRVYITGSALKTEDYGDIDLVVETSRPGEAREAMLDYEELDVERTFGELESQRTDKLLINGQISSTEFDITIHRTPYNSQLYKSENNQIFPQ